MSNEIMQVPQQNMTDESEIQRCAQCEIYREEIESLKRRPSFGWLWFILGLSLLAAWLFVLLKVVRPFDSSVDGWQSYLIIGLQMGSCFGAFYLAAAVALLFNAAGWKKAIAFSGFSVVLSGYLRNLVDEKDEVGILIIHGWIILPIALIPALLSLWLWQSTLSIGGYRKGRNAVSIGTFVWLTGWSAVYLMLVQDVFEKLEVDDIKIYGSLFMPLALANGIWGVRFLVSGFVMQSWSIFWSVLATLVLVVASTIYLFLFEPRISANDLMLLWLFGLIQILGSISIVIAGRRWLDLVCRDAPPSR